MFQSNGLFSRSSQQQLQNVAIFDQKITYRTEIREKQETINSQTCQSQLHHVCELENYSLKGFYSNLLLIEDRDTSTILKGDGLSLYNIETKKQTKLGFGHLFPEEKMIWNKTFIFFILQQAKGYAFVKSRINFLPRKIEKLFIKDTLKYDQQDYIFHNIDNNLVLIRVNKKCASIIYKKKLKIIRKIKKNIRNVGSKDDLMAILVKHQISLLKLSSFQSETFQQKLRQVCTIFFDNQSNLRIRQGYGTGEDTITNLTQKFKRPISFGYDCNNFALSVIENKILKIYRFGEIDQFKLNNTNKRSEEYLRLYSDENSQIIVYECNKQFTQIYQLKL